MNCPNCGAPMELFARRAYYFCQYCGSFEFIAAAGESGIAVLERRSAAGTCPVCSAPMATALLDGVSQVKHCERCGGLLMACTDFADAVARRRAGASGAAAAPAPVPLDKRELERHIACPSCAAPMDVHPYGGPGNIVIDSCSGCGLVWLDRGEIKQAEDAPGSDRRGSWTPGR